MLDILSSLPDICLFKRLTGWPCAGCGLTRAFACILMGDFRQAFYFNALSIPIFFMLLISLIWHITDKIRKTDTFERKILRAKPHPLVFVPLTLLVAANWIWNIVKAI